MKLNEMLSSFPDKHKRNELVLRAILNHFSLQMQMELLHYGLGPQSFVFGIHFILQHIAQNGLPADWEEIIHPVDPDPAKNSEVVITEEDGERMLKEVGEFFMAAAATLVPLQEEEETPPRDPLEGSGF